MDRRDVVVVGGGPAGLSAALMLGRCRRRVLVCDAGRPRNAVSRALHGYLTRDGMAPADFLARARAELAAYPQVELRAGEVREARPAPGGFALGLVDGTAIACRRLLLATGMLDALPDLPGFREAYGRSVFHCPYCDGYEWADRRLAVLGRGRGAAGLALELTVWSRDLVLLTDGPPELPADAAARLDALGIGVRAEAVAGLESEGGRLRRVRFRDGGAVERDALFFHAGQDQCGELLAKLGCPLNDKGTVDADATMLTKVPGLYVAGDISRNPQMAVVAAAEGAVAAIAINRDLLHEDLRGAGARV